MSLRILIVDDETTVRKMLPIAFKKAGYEVLSAADALEAMDVLAIERVDAVFSDVVMNSLSGHDLARWIAEHRPSVPCVLMTGFEDRGCNDCPFASSCIQLRKPFNPQDAGSVRFSTFIPAATAIGERSVSRGPLIRSGDLPTLRNG